MFLKNLYKIIGFYGTAGRQNLGYFSLMKYFGFLLLMRSVNKDTVLMDFIVLETFLFLKKRKYKFVARSLDHKKRFKVNNRQLQWTIFDDDQRFTQSKRFLKKLILTPWKIKISFFRHRLISVNLWSSSITVNCNCLSFTLNVFHLTPLDRISVNYSLRNLQKSFDFHESLVVI